jgi:hypothetical protein
MKDDQDKAGDHSRSPVARRQAAYKDRQEQAGKKRVQVWMDRDDWQAGFDTGAVGKPSRPGAEVCDQLAWFSGWIEGDAKRQGFEYSKGTTKG